MKLSKATLRKLSTVQLWNIYVGVCPGYMSTQLRREDLLAEICERLGEDPVAWTLAGQFVTED